MNFYLEEFEQFLQEQKKSAATIVAYKYDVSHFINWLQQNQVQEPKHMQEQHIAQYYTALTREFTLMGTLRRKRAALSLLLSFYEMKGYSALSAHNTYFLLPLSSKTVYPVPVATRTMQDEMLIALLQTTTLSCDQIITLTVADVLREKNRIYESSIDTHLYEQLCAYCALLQTQAQSPTTCLFSFTRAALKAHIHRLQSTRKKNVTTLDSAAAQTSLSMQDYKNYHPRR